MGCSVRTLRRKAKAGQRWQEAVDEVIRLMRESEQGSRAIEI